MDEPDMKTVPEESPRYRALLEASADLIIFITCDAIITGLHRPPYPDYPVFPGEHEGKGISDIMPPEVSRVITESIAEVRDSGASAVTRFTVPRGPVIHHYEARIACAGPLEFIIVIRDMTGHSHVEEALHESVEERTREINQLLRQKDEFISQLGHDLKTPLTPIKSLLPLLMRGESNPRKSRMLEIAIENTCYMERLISQTLQLARLNSYNFSLDMTSFNLRSLVKSSIAALKESYISRCVDIQNLIPRDLLVLADEMRLREVLDNLLNNAIQYSSDLVHVDVNAFLQGREVIISVCDHGIGMTENQLIHIFDEFYKADESRHDISSVGLGLAICKRIIEKHGGRIWAESGGPGKGTRVSCLLPAGLV